MNMMFILSKELEDSLKKVSEPALPHSEAPLSQDEQDIKSRSKPLKILSRKDNSK